jgi:hypothetical protein
MAPTPESRLEGAVKLAILKYSPGVYSVHFSDATHNVGYWVAAPGRARQNKSQFNPDRGMILSDGLDHLRR